MRRNTFAVAVHRMRERLRALVRAELAETVANAAELDDEQMHLRRALHASSAQAQGAPPSR
jgi:RNA polymerase sigma-70 factor (ECF subfamily)